MINLLVRTSQRPNFFRLCYNSIKEQTYKDINLIVNYDDVSSLEYLKGYEIDQLTNYAIKFIPDKKENRMIGGVECQKFPFNLYFNEMYKLCKPGYIMFLDDDDCFASRDALSKIIKGGGNSKAVIFWKVSILNMIVPSSSNFGKAPVCCDISGIGMAFHSDYIRFAYWDEYNKSDYRVANSLWQNVENRIFIDEVLTKSNRLKNRGHGKRDDLKRSLLKKLKRKS